MPLAAVFKTLGAGAVEEYAEFIPDGAPANAVQQRRQSASSPTWVPTPPWPTLCFMQPASACASCPSDCKAC